MQDIIITTKEQLESIIQASLRKVMGESLQQSSDKGFEYLSLKEASSFLNLASQTIYGLTSKREIPFLKRGKKLYFRKSELESWINEGKRKSISEIKSELEGGKNGN